MSAHFIVIDGLDGAGKSTLSEAARAWFIHKGLRIFDAVAWSKQHHYLPSLSDIGDADVLITAEPTHVGTGAAVRNIVQAVGTTYTSHQTAAAYALDRDLHNRQLVHPFLAANPQGWILQERGLTSSLAYQPLQSLRNQDPDPLTTAQVLALPGNQTALLHVPDLFVFLEIDAKTAQQRLSQRRGTEPEDIFDDQGFQHALRDRYALPEVTEPWTSRGTKIIHLDGSQSKDQVTQALVQELELLAK